MKNVKFVLMNEYICVLWMKILTAQKFEFLTEKRMQLLKFSVYKYFLIFEVLKKMWGRANLFSKFKDGESQFLRDDGKFFTKLHPVM
jgi:hypothetical protein